MEFTKLKINSLVGRFIFHITWLFLLIGPILLFASKGMMKEELQDSLLSTDDKINHVLWIHIGSVAFLILLGILVSLILLRNLTRPLKEITLMASAIAEGNFAHKITIHSGDELKILGDAFNQMADNLKRIVVRFQEVSHEVVVASGQIQSSAEKVTQSALKQAEFAEKTAISALQSATSTKSLSEGINVLSYASDATSSSILEMGATIGEISNQTVDLSKAVDTTSSSIIEMTSSIKEVAENVGHLSNTAQETAQSVGQIDSSVKEVEKIAKEAAHVSEKVSSDAHELGVRAIVKTIDGMKKIKETVEKSAEVINRLGKSSEDIGKILTVIKEVTKQTNLLALNAAILAAQAGEQGKGFAVVADEIKKLADRTASSTNEISQLVSDVQTETKDAVSSIQVGYESVEEGMRLSLAAGDAVGKILESSKNSAEMARKIVESTVEQVNGIRQIKLSVEKITSMAQEIVRATQEQTKGGEQIMSATEKMRNVTDKVRISTEEQLQGSRQISQAVENVNQKIQEMAKVIGEQKTQQELTETSISEIKNIANSHYQLADEMTQTVRQLVNQSDKLMKEISKIKV